ncbi:MAG: hypothetical protein ACK4RK_01680 [Gemmataceae bacterium]
MKYRSGMAWIVLLMGGLAQAQEAPERLLSANTQVYFRWDGLTAQRVAFEKTALSKIIFEEFGPLLDSLTKNLPSDEHSELFKKLARNGLVAGVEVRGVLPPEVQATLILPNSGDHADALFDLVRKGFEQTGMEVEQIKISGRVIHYIQDQSMFTIWWVDGKDIVMSLTTDGPKAMLLRQAGRAGVDKNPNFQKLQQFQEFPTSARGYVDLASLVKLVEPLSPEAAKAIDDLGLSDLQAIQMYLGYDGPALRTLVAIDAPQPRKGLVKLLTGKPFNVDNLPPMPPEITSFTATQLDLGTLYDVVLETVQRMAPPAEKENIQQQIAAINQMVGIDLRSELLGSLGNRVVMYNSKSAVWFLGLTAFIEVKDEAKLRKALTQLARFGEKMSQGKMSVRTSNYHNVSLTSVYYDEESFLVTPTFAIHDGWLVVGLYPQTVQDYILRQKGEIPAWVPDAAMKQALNRLPKEFTSVAMSDPRPGILSLGGWVPLIGAALASNQPDLKFDVSLIPNSYAVARHLFPTVSVSTDDGKTVRFQSWTAVPLADTIANFDMMTTIMLMGAITTVGQSATTTFHEIGEKLGEVPPPPK